MTTHPIDASELLPTITLLRRITKCDICNGTLKWQPECYACLAGEGKCTCSSQELEPCPFCEAYKDELAELRRLEALVGAEAYE